MQQPQDLSKYKVNLNIRELKKKKKASNIFDISNSILLTKLFFF